MSEENYNNFDKIVVKKQNKQNKTKHNFVGRLEPTNSIENGIQIHNKNKLLF